MVAAGTPRQREQHEMRKNFQELEECHSGCIKIESQRSRGLKSLYTEPCRQLSISKIGRKGNRHGLKTKLF